MIGFFNCLKPTGLTSSDVVVKLKKILNRKDVGHLGTLDPMASGVLPIAVGKATRMFDYIINSQKTYIATFLLGTLTDTLDSDGKILSSNNFNIDENKLKSALKDFVGVIMQTPPAYSAIKINGKRSYDLARSGKEFEIKAREVEIYDIKLINITEDKYFTIKVNCRGGTYIRSLGMDIAKKLGTVSTMVSLIRTNSSNFKIENSITIDQIIKSGYSVLTSLDDYLIKFQRFDIPSNYFQQLKNGVPLDKSVFNFDFEEKFSVYCDNVLFGIGHIVDDKLRIKTNLHVGE